MRYDLIWNAVDKLAKDNGLSPSGLAKKAGLDATTFNKSKRMRTDGKRRWPSLDSINKILEVCNTSFEDFYQETMDDGDSKPLNSIPFISYSKITNNVDNDNKNLVTNSWNKIQFPDNRDNLYAVDIDINNFAPLYRVSDILIISKNSDIRRGDRVLIILKDGNKQISEFIRRTAKSLEILNIKNNEESSILIDDIKLVNRIVWVSQ